MRFWEGYKGSSFLELLAIEHPHVKPDVQRWFDEMGQLPATAHGTTCIGMRFADGALVAGDRLATMGYQVASRDIQKVYATDDYSIMAIAGCGTEITRCDSRLSTRWTCRYTRSGSSTVAMA